MKYGHARVSTIDHNSDMRLKALQRATGAFAFGATDWIEIPQVRNRRDAYR